MNKKKRIMKIKERRTDETLLSTSSPAKHSFS
jgi:hypothetical protein